VTFAGGEGGLGFLTNFASDIAGSSFLDSVLNTFFGTGFDSSGFGCCTLWDLKTYYFGTDFDFWGVATVAAGGGAGDGGFCFFLTTITNGYFTYDSTAVGRISTGYANSGTFILESGFFGVLLASDFDRYEGSYIEDITSFFSSRICILLSLRSSLLMLFSSARISCSSCSYL
jgi:hypothetical protein